MLSGYNKEAGKGFFFVPISPMSARGRDRVSSTGHVYLDKKAKQHLQAIAQYASEYMHKYKLSTFRSEIFCTNLTVCKQKPASHNKKWCLVGDKDNYSKMFSDGLIRTFYADDKQDRDSRIKVIYFDYPGYLFAWKIIGYIDDSY